VCWPRRFYPNQLGLKVSKILIDGKSGRELAHVLHRMEQAGGEYALRARCQIFVELAMPDPLVHEQQLLRQRMQLGQTAEEALARHVQAHAGAQLRQARAASDRKRAAGCSWSSRCPSD